MELPHFYDLRHLRLPFFAATCALFLLLTAAGLQAQDSSNPSQTSPTPAQLFSRALNLFSQAATGNDGKFRAVPGTAAALLAVIKADPTGPYGAKARELLSVRGVKWPDWDGKLPPSGPAPSANPATDQNKGVPPTPKPADAGPSLEVTMNFIQEKLNTVGPVSYVAKVHDNASNQDWSSQFQAEATEVVANPKACQINYHWKGTRDGQLLQDQPNSVELKTVSKLSVMSREQNLKDETAASHPSYAIKVEPPVFILKIQKKDKTSNTFSFTDEQLANRIAKAMTHAVELCGGGGEEKEPF